MGTIKTYTGIMFDPLEPNTDLIRIEDIAHALAMLCRANEPFYSVVQHCIHWAVEAAARGCSVRVQLGCLLHEGSKSYLSDMTRPVKKLCRSIW